MRPSAPTFGPTTLTLRRQPGCLGSSYSPVKTDDCPVRADTAPAASGDAVVAAAAAAAAANCVRAARRDAMPGGEKASEAAQRSVASMVSAHEVGLKVELKGREGTYHEISKRRA